MKIFIYSTHALWPHHAETELEIMQKHLLNGDTIYRFVCHRELAVCDTNVEHKLLECLKCMDKQVIGQKLLEGSEKVITVPIFNRDHLAKAKETGFSYIDIGSFKEVKIDNFDIGYAVSSSVISALRDPRPDMIENFELYRNYFYSSLAIYIASLAHIEEYKPDFIYAFNGRVAHAKPILRAAQKLGIECRIHERGCDINHYGITVNTTPHDLKYFFTQMIKKWNEANPNERDKIGASFYEERVRGKEQAWLSFVKEQEKDLLPTDWNPGKRNIAIFNTSEDEFESIGDEWKNILYKTQAEGIGKILNSFKDDEKVHFYLRIHPNLKGINNRQMVEAYSLSEFENLSIIDADSPVSTYSLMNMCEKVITFGSSTGIEATYWGKPSILLGKSFYYELDVCYRPATHEEAVSLINSDLQPKNKMDTLKYGYYFKTFGEEFQYYKPTGILSGSFKNKSLDKTLTIRTALVERAVWYRSFINTYLKRIFKSPNSN